MTDDQIRAACEGANASGKRTWVHAHAGSAVRGATLAGCFTVTHGSQVTDHELALMAERGTFFEPNIGLMSQNYIENKARFLGIGNYDEAGFRFMEEGILRKLDMFKRAIANRLGAAPGTLADNRIIVYSLTRQAVHARQALGDYVPLAQQFPQTEVLTQNVHRMTGLTLVAEGKAAEAIRS